MVCFAPVDHLYGHLMGIAVPRLLGVPCRLARPDRRPGDAPSPGCAGRWSAPCPRRSPALRAACRRSRGLERLVLVHGSAVLPPAAAPLLGDAGRAREPGRAVRLHRDRPRRPPRRARDAAAGRSAPDVTLAAARPDRRPVRLLRVRSPLPGPPARRGPSRVRAGRRRHGSPPTAPSGGSAGAAGCSRSTGAASTSTQVEARLRDAVPGARLHCRPERDDLRGEWFTSYVAECRERRTAGRRCRRRAAACRRGSDRVPCERWHERDRIRPPCAALRALVRGALRRIRTSPTSTASLDLDGDFDFADVPEMTRAGRDRLRASRSSHAEPARRPPTCSPAAAAPPSRSWPGSRAGMHLAEVAAALAAARAPPTSLANLAMPGRLWSAHYFYNRVAERAGADVIGLGTRRARASWASGWTSSRSAGTTALAARRRSWPPCCGAAPMPDHPLLGRLRAGDLVRRALRRDAAGAVPRRLPPHWGCTATTVPPRPG